MNLHSNQIQFSAARPTKVQFVEKTNETAGAVKALSELVVSGITAKAEVDDQLLSSRLKTAEQAGLDLIEKAKEIDADYEEYGNRAINGFVSELNSAPEDVKERFLRRNPTAVEDYTLRVGASVALKTGNQIFSRLKLEIPRLSSTVLNAPKEKQQQELRTAMSILQNPNLSVEQVDALTYTLRQQVDAGLVETAILHEDWDTALKLLDNEDTTYTLSAPQRLQYKKEILSEIERARKELEQEAEKPADDLSKAKKAQEEYIENTVKETYAQLLRADRAEDAELFRQDVMKGNDIHTLDGSVIGSTAALSSVKMIELGADLKAIRKKWETSDEATALARASYRDAVRPLLNNDGDFIPTRMNDAIYYDLQGIYNNKDMFNNMLTETQQEQLLNFKIGYLESQTEDLFPTNKYPEGEIKLFDEQKYATTHPLGNISQAIAVYSGSWVPEDVSRSVYLQDTGVGNLYALTETYNKRHKDSKIEPGTRAQALLFATVGLGGVAATGVRQSLYSAGAKNADRQDLMEAFIMRKEQLDRAGMLESTRFSVDDIIEDIKAMLAYINGFPTTYTKSQDMTHLGVAQLTMNALKNPKKFKMTGFNLDKYYSDEYTNKYENNK